MAEVESVTSTKFGRGDSDSASTITFFPPFAEEDADDQSSYAIVSALFSRVRHAVSSSVNTTNAQASTTDPVDQQQQQPQQQPQHQQQPRRPSYPAISQQTSSSSTTPSNAPGGRPNPLPLSFKPAPPLVSLTPAQSELPTYSQNEERSPSRAGSVYSNSPMNEGEGLFGTSIPGFPIQDDARSIKTAVSLQRSSSVSKVIRRIRGEGLSRDYWMDDETCKECYDCKSVFTAWRRKHHCRICGQIFCSRCASNVIKGYRFGHDGMVRVCNLCLGKLANVENDNDEDDRRSFISSATSAFPPHQMGLTLNIEAPSSIRAYHPQSPYAASHLFGGAEEPFSLFSIAETKQRLGSDYDGSRSVSPNSPPIVPPFRRIFSDEDFLTENNGGGDIAFPTTPDVPPGQESSIQFPIESPEQGGGSDGSDPFSKMRSRLNSYAELSPSRSRVSSRLDMGGVFPGDPGWRERRESVAYAKDLNDTSMRYLKIMLRQMLMREEIPNIKDWESILLKLAGVITRDVTFTSLPQGEDLDIRRYVKIKKIPGGTPNDSEYVHGPVITKNVAHKQMSRFRKDARIMLVTFSLEFARVEGQYMHFRQIVSQEKEYLTNLASRIAALRPHVVIVENSVSRILLDALAGYGIAVARNVKLSAIQVISRMTNGAIISSMDKLAIGPQLGMSSVYRIQTFDHPLIPGRRKSYMRFEGCHPDLGCTVILRGADLATLRRVKKVMRFLTFLVRNLKLETYMWKDFLITLPPFNSSALPTSSILASRSQIRPPLRNPAFGAFLNATISPDHPLSASTSRFTTPTPSRLTSYGGNVHPSISEDDDDDLPDEDAERVKLSRRIEQALEPYTSTFISVSATLRFDPPYPIRRMKELDLELQDAKRAWEDEVVQREERHASSPPGIVSVASAPLPQRPDHQQQESTATVTMADFTHNSSDNSPAHLNDLNAQIEALPSSHEAETPSEAEDTPPGQESSSGYFTSDPAASLLGSGFEGTSILVSPLADEPSQALKTVADIALESRYEYVKWEHEEFKRIWEWYLRKNQDDFVVEKYQRLSTLEYVVPIADFGLQSACFAPKHRYITFYGENDMTLGQFLERSVTTTVAQFLDPKAICTGKGCDQPLARHCQVYVHNESRIVVAVEQWDGQILDGREGELAEGNRHTTWTICQKCGAVTPFIPVSPAMLRYSFGKFLELHFYPADVLNLTGCGHNIYQDHVRYFSYKGMTVRFQTSAVILHEVIHPPFRVRVRPETQLEMKNTDFYRLHERNVVWYTGLIDELKLTSIDAATGEEEGDARLLLDINNLIGRAEAEREDVSSLLNRVYKESAPTDTLALNQVRAYRQDKIVAWQADFDRLPKPRGIDGKFKRGSAFGSVRAMWPRRYELAGGGDHVHLPSSSVSEAEEGPLKTRRLTGDSFTSSASDASESESTPYPESKSEMRERPTTSSSPLVPFIGEESSSKSDVESDSTIGAAKEETLGTVPVTTDDDNGEALLVDSADSKQDTRLTKISKLPRRSDQHPSVADLVRKYSDYLPVQGMDDLAKTALSRAVLSESEQEYAETPIRQPRNRSKGRLLSHKTSASDFEQGYAANVAPKHLSHPRRSKGHAPSHAAGSRIPGPAPQQHDSQESSRRPSPEKRISVGLNKDRGNLKFRQPQSPPAGKTNNVGAGRARTRVSGTYGRSRDRTPARPTSSSGPGRMTFRRNATGGNKVGTMTKHFEKLSRDADKSKSRYNIIRGRRARPVASSRAKVEILDSVKDAMRDESDSSSSSEADDEGGGDEEDGHQESSKSLSQSTELDLTLPPPVISVASPNDEAAIPLEHKISSSPPAREVEPPVLVTPPPETELAVSPRIHPAHISLPPSPFLSSIRVDHSLSITPPSNENERNSILKALSGFWGQGPATSRSAVDGDADPMNDPEHIFRDSSMVVRTDEPTSIIALALNSPQYRDMLTKSRTEKRNTKEARMSDNGEAFMPDDRSIAESTSTWGVVNLDINEKTNPTEDLKAPSSKLPWAISFESGGLTISCTVLYPEQFDALRRTYDCDKSMIESLARCVKWNASGGKSGSAFLKTRDDRFIAKELSRSELSSMETFAPAYFDYMSSTVSADRPTLLSKIFGCYKITFRKTGSTSGGKTYKVTQMNLLVMENLFYDRKFSKIYDLKGSTRNRRVHSTGRENEVLLDENLVESAHIVPFYLREHSKRILRGSLYNDSKFLADINVMDYSLVCGVDSAKNELVVGIVDYVRTYTWDKKLESWVKESTYLVGGMGVGGRGKGKGNAEGAEWQQPTIVTPKMYRQRFLSAMERYFPLVPDRWMKVEDAPEETQDVGSSLAELWPDW